MAITRRGFLKTASTVSAGGLLAATSASALTLDAEPSVALRERYHAAKAACGVDAYHRQLIEEVKALLANAEVSEDERQRQLAALTCPLCGCRVVDG